MAAEPQPGCLVQVRLYVPPEVRSAYLRAMRAIGDAAGGPLLRMELYEDHSEEGFYLESYLFTDLGAWAAARDGVEPTLGGLLQARRGLIPAECEELLVYRTASGPAARPTE